MKAEASLKTAHLTRKKIKREAHSCVKRYIQVVSESDSDFRPVGTWEWAFGIVAGYRFLLPKATVVRF